MRILLLLNGFVYLFICLLNTNHVTSLQFTRCVKKCRTNFDVCSTKSLNSVDSIESFYKCKKYKCTCWLECSADCWKKCKGKLVSCFLSGKGLADTIRCCDRKSRHCARKCWVKQCQSSFGDTYENNI